MNTSKQDMCWTPCLILSIAWRIITSRENLKNNWRMKRILDEPSSRDSMKNSGNERMIERKRSWKHKVKPCHDLDGASRWYNRENLELQKERWSLSNGEMWHDEQRWKEETRSLGWNNNKNYVMRILHQFKLMTSNRFGILLILLEGLRIEITQTWEGIDGTTGGIWKQRMNWYDNEGSEILNEPP